VWDSVKRKSGMERRMVALAQCPSLPSFDRISISPTCLCSLHQDHLLLIDLPVNLIRHRRDTRSPSCQRCLHPPPSGILVLRDQTRSQCTRSRRMSICHNNNLDDLALHLPPSLPLSRICLCSRRYSPRYELMVGSALHRIDRSTLMTFTDWS
jgi:hypothetical protein